MKNYGYVEDKATTDELEVSTDEIEEASQPVGEVSRTNELLLNNKDEVVRFFYSFELVCSYFLLNLITNCLFRRLIAV